MSAPGLVDPTVPVGAPFPPGGHVAVVRLDGCGDVLLAGPAVRAVAARAERVTVVCGPSGAEAARLLPGASDVVVTEAPWVALDAPPAGPDALQALVAAWARPGFDAALVLTSRFQSSLPSALALKAAGVPLVAGISADHPGSLLDVRLRAAAGHEVERNLALAAAAGYPAVDGRDLRVRHRVADPSVRRHAVVVHPGASVPARALPPAAARQLVELLVQRGRAVVLTGSRRETAALGVGHLPGVIDLGGGTDLAGLAEVLAAAAVIVVGNTGPAHLAAAVGTPVVSVFAPVVEPECWRPWTDRAVLLGDLGCACGGCRARRCPFPGQPCTTGIDGAALLAAVDQVAGVEPICEVTA